MGKWVGTKRLGESRRDQCLRTKANVCELWTPLTTEGVLVGCQFLNSKSKMCVSWSPLWLLLLGVSPLPSALPFGVRLRDLRRAQDNSGCVSLAHPAPSRRWLKDSSNDKDFFLDLAQFPVTKL